MLANGLQERFARTFVAIGYKASLQNAATKRIGAKMYKRSINIARWSYNKTFDDKHSQMVI